MDSEDCPISPCSLSLSSDEMSDAESGASSSSSSSSSSSTSSVPRSRSECDFDPDLKPLLQKGHDLPDGPDTVWGLFQWPIWNAEQLLCHSKHADTYVKNFKLLMGYKIQIHDSYSGMGTGSIALHIQYKHLVGHCLKGSFTVVFFSDVHDTHILE